MKFKKARTIKKALQYFDPLRPLTLDKELEAFYVSREGIHLDEMIRILLQTSGYPKMLFSGPPGCGKATELTKLKSLLYKDFHLIFFSAKDMTNNFQITPEIVLYNILRRVGDIAKQKKLKIYDEKIDPLMKRIQGWETQISQVNTSDKPFDPSTYEKIEKGEVKIKGEFKKVSSKTLGKPTANETIGAINETVKELEKRRYIFIKGKKVLLLITDMDKLEIESARNLFIKSFLNLIKINCCAVFTFPLELKYDKDFVRMYRNFSGIYYLKNFEIKDKDDKLNETGLEKIKLVIEKRMNENLTYPEVIDRIIYLSGGILYELINIIRECCIIALREKINYIDEDVLEEAIERIRTNYKIGLAKEDSEILYWIHENKAKPDTTNLTKLLNQYSITEYGEGEEVWYDINPILLPIIRRIQLTEE